MRAKNHTKKWKITRIHKTQPALGQGSAVDDHPISGFFLGYHAASRSPRKRTPAQGGGPISDDDEEGTIKKNVSTDDTWKQGIGSKELFKDDDEEGKTFDDDEIPEDDESSSSSSQENKITCFFTGKQLSRMEAHHANPAMNGFCCEELYKGLVILRPWLSFNTPIVTITQSIYKYSCFTIRTI